MTTRDQEGWTAAPRENDPWIVPMAQPHAEIGHALRTGFASPPKLPAEWAQLLDRLR